MISTHSAIKELHTVISQQPAKEASNWILCLRTQLSCLPSHHLKQESQAIGNINYRHQLYRSPLLVGHYLFNLTLLNFLPSPPLIITTPKEKQYNSPGCPKGHSRLLSHEILSKVNKYFGCRYAVYITTILKALTSPAVKKPV